MSKHPALVGIVPREKNLAGLISRFRQYTISVYYEKQQKSGRFYIGNGKKLIKKEKQLPK